MEINLVGPLFPPAGRHQFIWVVVNYMTQYPEAMLLRDAKASTVARELTVLFPQVGFSKQVMTDQGTVFMWRLLGLHPLRTSVYHPQTNGLEERFNGTLKQMLT